MKNMVAGPGVRPAFPVRGLAAASEPRRFRPKHIGRQSRLPRPLLISIKPRQRAGGAARAVRFR